MISCFSQLYNHSKWNICVFCFPGSTENYIRNLGSEKLQQTIFHYLEHFIVSDGSDKSKDEIKIIESLVSALM